MIVIISFINPTAKERVLDRTINQLFTSDNRSLIDEKKINHKKIYIFSHQHTDHYIAAYRMFLDNKVLGVGVKNFRNFCSEKKYQASSLSCSTHPHNSYVQILAETGIVGFLFFMTTLLYFCKYVYKHLIYIFKGKYYFNDFEICVLSAIAIYLWPFIPTGNIFNNWLNILLIINLPFLIWSRSSNSSKN